MSHIALARGLKILHYLVQQEDARFKDLSRLLDPISPASQMRLLKTLIKLGEIEKSGNRYRLSVSSSFAVLSSSDPFAVKPEVSEALETIIRWLARETSYAAGLFCWETPGAMKIMNSYAPLGTNTHYRPAGQEWPLLPSHDFAQVFLAYAPAFFQEDVFFSWNQILSEDYRVSDFNRFLERLESIKNQQYTVSEKVSSTFGSLVKPIFVHGEKRPRFAVGILLYGNPSSERIERFLESIEVARNKIGDILRESFSPKQLELSISRKQANADSAD